MVEGQTDAKDDFENTSNKVLDDLEKGTPPDSSTDIKPEDHANDTDVDPGAEPVKAEQVKEVESDDALSVEEKIEKVKEILGEDQDAIDAYVKEKGYHTDPAWIKQRERIDTLEKEAQTKVDLSEEDKTALADFKALSSSAEFIQMTMKQKGFTQEAIDEKLKESGFEVKVKAEDDLQFILDKTGSVKEDMTKDQLNQVEDMIKIANLLIESRMNKILPQELAPIRKHLNLSDQERNASKISDTMEKTITDEGVLDYKKDIEPELNKFMDDNQDAKQEHILEHFKLISRQLTIERLKGGKRKEERDEKKTNLRQNISTVKTPTGLPEKTRDYDKDADAFLDAAGINF